MNVRNKVVPNEKNDVSDIFFTTHIEPIYYLYGYTIIPIVLLHFSYYRGIFLIFFFYLFVLLLDFFSMRMRFI